MRRCPNGRRAIRQAEASTAATWTAATNTVATRAASPTVGWLIVSVGTSTPPISHAKLDVVREFEDPAGLGGEGFVDHLALEVDRREACRAGGLVGAEQPAGPLDLCS